MATRKPFKNALYFGFRCSNSKTKSMIPILLLLLFFFLGGGGGGNNYPVKIKLSSKFTTICRQGFRATLNFRKLKVPLNALLKFLV